MPFARKHYRRYLPLMPFAIERFDLRGYDLVISNSSAVAKGVPTGPEQLHVCMCLSPIRYAWDLQDQYLKESGLDRGLRGMLARGPSPQNQDLGHQDSERCGPLHRDLRVHLEEDHQGVRTRLDGDLPAGRHIIIRTG